MLDRKIFYQNIKPSLFAKLTTSQVEGIEAILNEWDDSGLTDLRWLAYMLATTKHETAGTMQPIEEYGKGKGKEYGKPHPVTGKIYYGRGDVQLTWYENYKKMAKLLGVDLVYHPELALRIDIAVKIMFEGMCTGKSFKGDFTGKHLGNYFNKTTEDWFNARRIINSLDRAQLVAGYGVKFHEALKAACSC